MCDYRIQVDNILSEWCIANNVEYTDQHDEAFCIKVRNQWVYIWYCEDLSSEEHLKQLKRHLNQGGVI